MQAIWRLVAAALIMAAFSVPARADLELPGVGRDSNAYAASLTRRFPAGASATQRLAAEQQAQAALTARNLDAAVTALETRAGQGEASRDIWLALADAQLHRPKPDPQRALLAAWQAWTHGDLDATGIPALMRMAEALRVLNRRVQELDVLHQATELAPDDQDLAARLAQSVTEAGMLVRRVSSEADSDPARACISFTIRPTKRRDFLPADWVRLDPPAENAAVTLEGDNLCVSGLPSGRSTKITLRAGLPGLGDTKMAQAETVSVAMPNRSANVSFDTRLFVLPRARAATVGLSTVNIPAVKLRLVRLTERNVAALLRRVHLGEALESWGMESLAQEAGSTVWQGRAEIPGYTVNKTTRTAMPLPDALQTAGPGLYALAATAGDGMQSSDASSVQFVLRTDLAPTVWRGSNGLVAQIRDYGTAEIRPGVMVRLLAQNNDILAETTTDDQGTARFPAALLRGEGPLAPAALHMFAKLTEGEDFAALDLNSASFDLSDRGVAGQPHPGPLDAYLWTERGIYRPGETVNLMALVRDNSGAPADLPVHITTRRPNGQVFQDLVPQRLADAAIHVPVTLSNAAPAGVWTVELRADPKGAVLGQTSFRVDAFVPERLAVDVGDLPKTLIPGNSAQLPLTARFLYGAPGSELTGSATLRLAANPEPFPALAGYQIGVEGEQFAPDLIKLDVPNTDAAGRSTIEVLLKSAPDTTQALKAEIAIAINDPSGRSSRANTTIPVRPSGPLIGIKPLFPDHAVNADTEASFDVAAVNADGRRIALKTRLRLVRERPDWRLVTREGQARYETIWRDEPLESRDLPLAADAPTRVVRKLPFGRYRIEVLQPDGLALTTTRFRAGWADSDAPDVPDKVDVSVDRKVIPAGETARVHIAPPFAGQATVAVLTDRVHALRNITIPAGGSEIDIPVDATWGPGAYIAVHVFRAGANASRAIGLTHVTVDPAARQLPLAIEVPAKIAPRQRQLVVVRTTPGAWVSLAAVDEGILRLTRFTPPDAAPHFLGRRRLGIDIRDDWGRLIKPADGEATLLHQGGDDGGLALPEIPQRTVSLFTPPVQAGPDGTARITLDIPDFAGSVRLMAMGWQASRIGAANMAMTVRDPLVGEALLPRFLSPGDEARLAVLLQNLDLPAGLVTARLTVEGPLALGGPDRLEATLAPGARALPNTTLRATGIGRGVIHLALTAPGGFSVTRDSAITIRPARATTTEVSASEIAPGASLALAPKLDKFLFGTGTATASFGLPVRYSTQAVMAALDSYPFACLEQSTSRGLPLTMLPKSDETAAKLQQAVALVLDKQRYDGSFGLWSGNGDTEEWLSSYAMDMLIRARAAGATVPEPAMQDGLRHLAGGINTTDMEPKALAAEAYRLFVLAKAGQGRPGAARVLLEQIERLPTQIAKAQLGAALALAHDQPRAEAAFGAALLAPARRWWNVDYGTALRDQLALVVLLKESGLMADRLATLIAQLPGPDLAPGQLYTQELAWAGAASAVLGRDGRPISLQLGTATLQGANITTGLTQPTMAKNLADRPVWASLATTGIPLQPQPAARAGLRVLRKFLTQDGTALNLDSIRQNDVFILVLEGRADDGQPHQLALTEGLPAGWEIAGRLSGGDNGAVPGMAWLGALTPTDAQPAADDRFAAIISTTAQKPDFRVAVRLRAVTPGNFQLPGAELVDMYRPSFFARQGEGRIKVAGAE